MSTLNALQEHHIFLPAFPLRCQRLSTSQVSCEMYAILPLSLIRVSESFQKHIFWDVHKLENFIQ